VAINMAHYVGQQDNTRNQQHINIGLYMCNQQLLPQTCEACTPGRRRLSPMASAAHPHPQPIPISISILISPTMAVVSQMALLNPHLCGAQLA